VSVSAHPQPELQQTEAEAGTAPAAANRNDSPPPTALTAAGEAAPPGWAMAPALTDFAAPRAFRAIVAGVSADPRSQRLREVATRMAQAEHRLLDELQEAGSADLAGAAARRVAERLSAAAEALQARQDEWLGRLDADIAETELARRQRLGRMIDTLAVLAGAPPPALTVAEGPYGVADPFMDFGALVAEGAASGREASPARRSVGPLEALLIFSGGAAVLAMASLALEQNQAAPPDPPPVDAAGGAAAAAPPPQIDALPPPPSPLPQPPAATSAADLAPPAVVAPPSLRRRAEPGDAEKARAPEPAQPDPGAGDRLLALAGEGAVPFTRSMTLDAQRTLSRLGYYSGPIDGVETAELHDAIGRYARDVGASPQVLPSE
jgi:hypothetical protein